MTRLKTSIFILILSGSFAFAQDFPPIDMPQGEIADTVSQEDFGLFSENNKNTFRVLFSGNPGRAALYSLVLPGAGQLYNKRYWKIPIVYAGLAGVVYLYYENNKVYQEYKQLYVDNIDNSKGKTYYNYYIQAKQYREQAIFAVVGVYLFNVLDAYIDRHLIDFDIDEDLSFQLKPFPDGISPFGLCLKYHFSSERVAASR